MTSKDSDVEFYEIGSKIWSRGDEVTITSKPYILHGAEWQDGVTEAGKTVTLVTPRQGKANVERSQREYREQQAQFRNLKT